MKNLDSWPLLAAAAADVTDELRALLPRLDAAIASGEISIEQRVRPRSVGGLPGSLLCCKPPHPQFSIDAISCQEEAEGSR